MKVTLIKLAGAGAMIAALAAAPATAQQRMTDEDTVSKWDRNNDGVLSEDEFNRGFRKIVIFSEWDKNGDGKLTVDEYREGKFRMYDQNRDNKLEKNEINELQRDMEKEKQHRKNR